jgi:hypothetical protein
MRFFSPFWAVASLTLAACGGGTPEESLVVPAVMSSTEARLEERFLRNANAVPGQYIVVFKDGVSASDVEVMAQELAGRYSGQVNGTFQYALRGFAVSMDATNAQAMALEPSVEFVEEDGWVSVDAVQQNATWGLDRVDQRDLPLNGTYEYFTDGRQVHAYVIDTGILASHADFAGRASLDFTSIPDGRGATDCNGHGTHVAGTLGGAQYGVAKRVRLHSVRVLDCGGWGTFSGVIRGVDWVTGNATSPAVANMSLGGGISQALDLAVSNSIGTGIVYAVAAGNGAGASACNYSPARVPAAITVGSTDRNDYRSAFSNIGSCVDIFAPGTDITSDWWTSTTAISTRSGTSMATPHVAGAAALYLGMHPMATPEEVAQKLGQMATQGRIQDVGAGSPDKLLYTGLLNPANLCKGSTRAGEGWVQYNADTIFLDINTTECGFTSTPLYFTSMGGEQGQWLGRNPTAIYQATAINFRVYIKYPGATPELARQYGWFINWNAAPSGLHTPQICTGKTAMFNTAWQPYPDGVYVDVNTSGCGFTTAPQYFTSLGGDGSQLLPKGATSIYEPTATGFRVYLYHPGMTPASANSHGWHLNWQALPNNSRTPSVCTGKTVQGNTAWKQYLTDGIYLDVDTSMCGLSATPKYFTSLGGESGTWKSLGANAIYIPTSRGFRILVNYPGITPAIANGAGWYLNWSAR